MVAAAAIIRRGQSDCQLPVAIGIKGWPQSGQLGTGALGLSSLDQRLPQGQKRRTPMNDAPVGDQAAYAHGRPLCLAMQGIFPERNVPEA
jgi:hypothetical protein